MPPNPPQSLKASHSVNLELWLKYGYFPNGLPPCFSTDSFTINITKILGEWPNSKKPKRPRESSKPVTYSIIKGVHARRLTHLTNPVHQAYLTQYVCDKWIDITHHLNTSPISLSTPIVDEKCRRYLRPVKEHKNLDDYRIHYTACAKYVLHVDLQSFYNSIYTHSIEWAFIGKEKVKADRKSSSSPTTSHLQGIGKELDKLLRNTKEAETKGIPVGPDTSLVIAEIIGAEIDRLLEQKLKGFNFSCKAYRHVDDMAFYVTEKKHAQDILEALHVIANEYHLQINEIKTHIAELPEPFKTPWTFELATFNFENRIYDQLRHFFTKAFEIQKSSPTSSVLKYALQIIRPYANRRNLKYVEIKEGNSREWEFLEAVLSQTLLKRPDTIILIHDILVWYKRKGFPLKTFKEAVNIFLAQTPFQCDFELAWGLWLAQVLDVRIDTQAVLNIQKSSNPIVRLLALNLHDSGSIAELASEDWKKDLASQSGENNDAWLARLLYSDNWLLFYECALEGWLGLDKSCLDNDSYFKILKDKEVRFFRRDRELTDEEIDIGLSQFGVGGMAGTGGASGTNAV